jgi:hypothetical protein
MRTTVGPLAATFLASGPGIAAAQQPAAPPPSAGAWGEQAANISGTVRQFELTPSGEVEGLILNDGTEVHLPPPAAYQVSVWVQPGQTITAQGYVLSNAFGRVMNVQAVGPSQQRLAQVTWMAPHGHGKRPPQPPGPDAPQP